MVHAYDLGLGAKVPTADEEARARQRLEKLKQDGFVVDMVPLHLIDHPLYSYGRPVSEPRVKKMLIEDEGLSEEQVRRKMDVITLSIQPNGRFNCVNGNHRCALARLLGYTHILAQVFFDLTWNDESDVYVALHSVNLPSATDRFKARLFRQDPVAVDIDTILRRHGLHVSVYNGPAQGGVAAVRALEEVYTIFGPGVFEEIITVLTRAWGQDRRAYVTSMISGMSAFWQRYRNMVSQERLVEKLQAVTPTKVLAEAGDHTLLRESPASRVGQTIYRIYHLGLRHDSKFNLPEWSRNPKPTEGAVRGTRQ
jgi:hypothetical protein